MFFCCVTSTVHVQSTWLVIGGRISLLKTEAFESSSGERMMSFPLTPQALTMHAIKCMILLFDRFCSLSFLAPLPQLQLKKFSSPLLSPHLPDNKQGHVFWGWSFFALHLILCANALSPLHTLQTFYNILRQNIHALRLIVEFQLALCFYYLTARQLLFQPSSITLSPSAFGVALSYVWDISAFFSRHFYL